MLKDLVWKRINKDEELSNLRKKWEDKSNSIDGNYKMFFYDNAEQIAKEKAEILNKPIEYTKQDIIDMFVEAGFEWDENNQCLLFDKRYSKMSIKCIPYQMSLTISKDGFIFETNWIDFNDRKSIEFYYNIFRNILEFETNKGSNDSR